MLQGRRGRGKRYLGSRKLGGRLMLNTELSEDVLSLVSMPLPPVPRAWNWGERTQKPWCPCDPVFMCAMGTKYSPSTV